MAIVKIVESQAVTTTSSTASKDLQRESKAMESADSVDQGIKLLNARFEEAFATGISNGDYKYED